MRPSKAEADVPGLGTISAATASATSDDCPVAIAGSGTIAVAAASRPGSHFDPGLEPCCGRQCALAAAAAAAASAATTTSASEKRSCCELSGRHRLCCC